MLKKTLSLLLLLMLVGLALPAFAAGPVSFDKSVSSVFEGETAQTILNIGDEAASGVVTYTSSDKRIATVDAAGVVTGIKKGQVQITATVKTDKKSYRASLNFSVYRRAEAIEVKAGKLTPFSADDPLISGLLAEPTTLPVLALPLKSSVELRTTVEPATASNRRVVITSSNPDVLQVKGSTLTAKAAGEADLTVANELSPEVSVSYHVLVVTPVKKLTFSEKMYTVAVGGQKQLSVTADPQEASIPAVTWKSADEQTATVDENGLVSGLKKGTAQITATAVDGSGVRATVTVKVAQMATGVALNKAELTIDVGARQQLIATVTPANTNDKTVIWSSSDEKVATVNQAGRITAVGVGDCDIVCVSETTDTARASARVHVQQPVTKISFAGSPSEVYLGKALTVVWTVEPANATNPAVTLSSSDKRILTVDEYGVVTPVKRGEAYVIATATDGSGKRGRLLVKVLQPVEGVHMENRVAYVSLGETASARAVLEPRNADNHNMSWVSADPSVASVSGEKIVAKIHGEARGETVVTGITQDGGFNASLIVRVGDWDRALRLRNVTIDGRGNVLITVRNDSDLTITRVTATVEFFDESGEPLAVNTKDGSNKVNAIYRRTLSPGRNSSESDWNFVNYEQPANGFGSFKVTVVSYVIDKDWTKNIRQRYRPTDTFVLR